VPLDGRTVGSKTPRNFVSDLPFFCLIHRDGRGFFP
jgi:hypothetical protein